MTTWAHRPAVHPGDVVEADEERHDAGGGRLILLVTAVGWRERRANGTIWLNLRGIRIQPSGIRVEPGGIRIQLGGSRIDSLVPAEQRSTGPAGVAVPTNGGTRLSRCVVRVLLDPVPDQALPGAAHLPGTPDWSCLACAGEWPCPTARIELPLTFAGRRRSLGAYLAAGYQRACRDLPDVPSRELYRRFLGWLSRDE
jgi:hypothetical protein